MARRSSILAPSAASLPDTFRIPANTSALIKSLGRLSRSSLIALVLQWLDGRYVQACRPYLRDDAVSREQWEDDDDGANPYDPAASIDELRELYTDLQERKGGKREVVDRILEGDWRNGLTLRQLAMADVRFIEDHPTASCRWTALQLSPHTPGESAKRKHDSSHTFSTPLPQSYGPTFLKSLQSEISPLVKAHYYISRSANLPLTFVRIFIIDSPYQYPRQSPYTFTDASRLIYLVFPDSSPFIYSSLYSIPALRNSSSSTSSRAVVTTDTRTLRRIVMDAIPKALSRPQHRYTLKPTSLTTKNLHTLLALRGPGRTNAANGAFSVFADAAIEEGPLDPRLPKSISTHESIRKGKQGTSSLEAQKENIPQTVPAFTKRSYLALADSDNATNQKRQKTILSRFGTGASSRSSSENEAETLGPRTSASPTVPVSANPSLEKLEIHLQDPVTPLPQDQEPVLGGDITLTVTFSGSEVISGLRQLAELGVVDATKMPSWMTGEEGVSSATVRNGKRIVNDG